MPLAQSPGVRPRARRLQRRRNLPWQTDTCIGSWHYERSRFDQHQYKTAQQVVQMLVDIVSKNGNLMLNIPVRGEGTIDDDELKVLEGLHCLDGRERRGHLRHSPVENLRRRPGEIIRLRPRADRA